MALVRLAQEPTSEIERAHHGAGGGHGLARPHPDLDLAPERADERLQQGVGLDRGAHRSTGVVALTIAI